MTVSMHDGAPPLPRSLKATLPPCCSITSCTSSKKKIEVVVPYHPAGVSRLGMNKACVIMTTTTAEKSGLCKLRASEPELLRRSIEIKQIFGDWRCQ